MNRIHSIGLGLVLDLYPPDVPDAGAGGRLLSLK